MTKENESAKKPSFWDTIAGKITKITTFIGVITALVTALSGGFDTIMKFIKTVNSPHQEVSISPPVCSTNPQMVEAEILKILPYSLKNTLELQEPYWLNITVQNKEKEPVYLKGIFRVQGSGSIKEGGGQKDIGRVFPGKKETFKINLPVEFLINDDFEEPKNLDIEWVIEDEKACKVKSGSGKVIVLPKNMFAWDFAPPGGAFSEEFLLASLTAWTQKPAKSVKDRAKTLLNTIEGADFENQMWFKGCYALLQELMQKRQLIRFKDTFPPQKEKQHVIYTSSQILEGSRPNPLEAALFMKALSN